MPRLILVKGTDEGKQFELTDAQVRQIEDEGIEKEWPPLNEAVQTIG